MGAEREGPGQIASWCSELLCLNVTYTDLYESVLPSCHQELISEIILGALRQLTLRVPVRAQQMTAFPFPRYSSGIKKKKKNIYCEVYVH